MEIGALLYPSNVAVYFFQLLKLKDWMRPEPPKYRNEAAIRSNAAAKAKRKKQKESRRKNRRKKK
jgi:hypothetical protein